jgi:hypothetical protein
MADSRLEPVVLSEDERRTLQGRAVELLTRVANPLRVQVRRRTRLPSQWRRLLLPIIVKGWDRAHPQPVQD